MSMLIATSPQQIFAILGIIYYESYIMYTIFFSYRFNA